MPFDTRSRWYNSAETRTEADVASATKTATGNGTAFNTDDVASLSATLAVSAASGTAPTLDVSLETTVNGTDWLTVAAFAQQTGTQTGLTKVFGPLGAQCRWKWTIAGTTPSFTLSITSTVKRSR